MKLARAFRDRHWGAAVAIDLIAGPFFAMLYLGRGRLALAYGFAEAVFFVATFALVVRFNLIGPSPGGDLGGWAYLAVTPIRIVGAFHAARLARARARARAVAWERRWYARQGALIALAVALVLSMRVSAALVRVLWMEPFEMKSAVMAPAIAEGDHVFVDKRAYLSVAPTVGDIVVVRDQDGISYIRRIAAERSDMFTVTGEGATERALTVPRGAIVGRVTMIFWSIASHSWQWERPR